MHVLDESFCCKKQKPKSLVPTAAFPFAASSGYGF